MATLSQSIIATASKLSFPKFLRLPKEIQILIWRAALPGPRIVHLQRHSIFNGTAQEYRYTTQATIPLLYTCRESYEVASAVYTRAFGTPTSAAEVWFDFERDILYIDGEEKDGDNEFETAICFKDVLGDIGKVRNLAYGGVGTHAFDPGYEDDLVVRVLREFKKVISFTLVDKAHELHDTRDLFMMDVTELEHSLCFLEHGTTDDHHEIETELMILHEKHGHELEKKQPFELGSFSMKFVHHALKDRALRKLPTIGRKLPTVGRKTITTRRKMEEYYRAKKAFQAQMDLCELCAGFERCWI